MNENLIFLFVMVEINDNILKKKMKTRKKEEFKGSFFSKFLEFNIL